MRHVTRGRMEESARRGGGGGGRGGSRVCFRDLVEPTADASLHFVHSLRGSFGPLSASKTTSCANRSEYVCRPSLATPRSRSASWRLGAGPAPWIGGHHPLNKPHPPSNAKHNHIYIYIAHDLRIVFMAMRGTIVGNNRRLKCSNALWR